MNLLLSIVALTTAGVGWLLSAVAPAVATAAGGPVVAVVLVFALPIVVGCKKRRH